MTYLFVYGTLRRGVANRFARRLSRCALYVGRGRVRGRLYRIGHYPGLVISGSGDDWVVGDVYSVEHQGPVFRMLDAYEGVTAPGEFRRVSVLVVLESGERVQAWVYAYTRRPVGLPRIVSGDFVRPRLRRASGALNLRTRFHVGVHGGR